MLIKYSAVIDMTLDIIQYISLEVYVLQLIPLGESETLGMGPRNLCFNKQFQCRFSFCPIWILPTVRSVRHSKVSLKGIPWYFMLFGTLLSFPYITGLYLE